jgi:hypothetical protein
MESEIYTPELERQLIKYYYENTSKYFDKLKSFINYTDEVKDLLLDEALNYCKSKQDVYDKSKSSPIRFFAIILTRITMSTAIGLINYLEEKIIDTDYQIDSNYWKALLTKAKREYDIKNLLIL